MPKFLAAVLLLLGASSAAHADSNPQWFRVQSDHFTVITDSNDKQARHVAGQFERMRSLFHTLFPAASSDGPPITVFAFKDKKGFNAVEPAAYQAKGSLQLAGLFMRMQDKNYILVRLDDQGEEEHPWATVYHEYTHYMLRKDEWLPLWLNEGLAEFYQNTDIEGKDVRLGQPSPDDILYLRDHPLIPLTTLLAVDYSSPYYHQEQKGSVFYAESWALTHFIELNDFDNKTHRMQDYAKFLQQHQDAVTAAQHAFGDLGQLQKQLNGYISGFSFKLFTIKESFTVDEASFKSTPISLSDVNALRADILVDNDRTPEATALLDKILAEDPNNALAHETEGYVCMRKQDYECARKWFTEAVKLDSQSPMANYYFAAMSLQAGANADPAAIEASLKASIKAQPTFAPAYEALADFYGMHDEKLDEAHMLLVNAIGLEPESVPYRLNAATLEMQRNNLDNAVRILEAAAQVAKHPEDIQMVQSRLDQLKEMQAQGARIETTHPTAPNGPLSPGVTTSAVTSAVTSDGKTFTVSAEQPATIEKTYPVADASAKHHTVSGTLHEVKCSYPTTLTLTLEEGTKAVPLFTANYYKVPFTTANFAPPDNLNPCKAIEGMKARIEYADVTDPDLTGQIVSIELSK